MPTYIYTDSRGPGHPPLRLLRLNGLHRYWRGVGILYLLENSSWFGVRGRASCTRCSSRPKPIHGSADDST